MLEPDGHVDDGVEDAGSRAEVPDAFRGGGVRIILRKADFFFLIALSTVPKKLSKREQVNIPHDINKKGQDFQLPIKM